MKINKKYVLALSVFSLTTALIFAPNILATLELPTISTACESKTGLLMAAGDGYSIFKSCPGGSRRVLIIGEKGDTGSIGPVGPQGPQGEKGDKGDPGIQGLTGLDGGIGPQGEKGDKGDTGSQGPTGGIKVFDANNTELGYYTGTGQFFDPELNLIINYSYSTGNIGISNENIWYLSDDCSGDGYIKIETSNYPYAVNILHVNGPGKYYTINRGTGGDYSLNSNYTYDGGTFNCISTTTDGNAYKVSPATVSFPDPISVPVQYHL